MLINASSLDTSRTENLIDGVLPRVGWGIFWGPSHIGKSLVAANELNLAVANGTDFFGHQALHGNTVLALGEGSYDAGVRMAARIAREHRDRDAEAARITERDGEQAGIIFEAGLKPYTDERVFVETTPFEVTFEGNTPSASLVNAISQFAQIPDLELVILDALPDFSGGKSISNDTMCTRFVMGVKHMVASLDCLVLCVHHATKKGDEMIGGIRLFNAADFVAHIAKDDTQPDEQPSATITFGKNKYGRMAEPMSYVVEEHEWHEPATDADGNLTGGPDVLVTSASVRLRSGDAGAGTGTSPLVIPAAPGQPTAGTGLRLVLPDIKDTPRPARKRSGIRSARPAVAPGPEEAARLAMITAILSGECPDCARPAAAGCDPGVQASDLIILDRRPLVVTHTARLAERIAAGTISPDDLAAQFGAGDPARTAMAAAVPA